MATRRKGVLSRSRITTRSSKANELPEFISTVVTQETATSSSLSSPERKSINASSHQFNNDVFENDGGCGWSTPKAKRFRIPEIESCPPAPKKQRSTATTTKYGSDDCISDDGVKCSLRRSSIPFFKPSHELAEFVFGSVSPFDPYVSTTVV